MANTTAPNIPRIKPNQYISIEKYDNDLLTVTNTDTNSQHKYTICKNESNNIISSFYNKLIIDTEALNELEPLNINDHHMEITKYSLESLHICLFNDNDIWYITYPNVLISLTDTNNKIIEIFLSLCSDTIPTLNTQYAYHLLLKHNYFKKIGYINDNYQPSVTLLWINEKFTCNILNLSDPQFNSPFQIEKIYEFASVQDVLSSLDVIDRNDINSKKLSCGGYHIRLKEKNGYKCYLLRTLIYKHLVNLVSVHSNKYVSYLELYQKNLLGETLPYLHRYSADIIRRINMAIKTLSKELLNIYHATRKKQNNKLYNVLTQSYKKVLYDLHTIYVNYKSEEYNNGNIGKLITEKLLAEKRSISVDTVYVYLKKIDILELQQIFFDREILINNLTNIKYNTANIFIMNNIDIITQIELMKLNP
jgi:hypothetical protein